MVELSGAAKADGDTDMASADAPAAPVSEPNGKSGRKLYAGIQALGFRRDHMEVLIAVCSLHYLLLCELYELYDEIGFVYAPLYPGCPGNEGWACFRLGRCGEHLGPCTEVRTKLVMF